MRTSSHCALVLFNTKVVGILCLCVQVRVDQLYVYVSIIWLSITSRAGCLFKSKCVRVCFCDITAILDVPSWVSAWLGFQDQVSSSNSPEKKNRIQGFEVCSVSEEVVTFLPGASVPQPYTQRPTTNREHP